MAPSSLPGKRHSRTRARRRRAPTPSGRPGRRRGPSPPSRRATGPDASLAFERPVAKRIDLLVETGADPRRLTLEIRSPSDSTAWSTLRVDTPATCASCTTETKRARFTNVCAIALSNQIADHFYVF